MLVGAPPPVDQPKLALVEVVDAGGVLVSVTVGAPLEDDEDVTCHVYVAEELPAELATVTRNVCVPTARPL